jgi:hypothetical protein
MPKRVKRVFQVGEWFLAHKRGATTWFRCRFNPRTRQTERVSLQTADLAEAKRLLTQWFAAHGDGPMEQEVTLA